MSIVSPRRVLVLTSTFPRYAGDVMPPFVLRLCQALQAQGWESRVLAPHERGLATQESVEGVSCHRFRYAPARLEQLAYGGGMLANVREARWRWLLLPFYLAALLFYSVWLIRRDKIAIVHAHWVIPQGLVAALLKKLFAGRRLRFVMTAHGGDLHANMGGLVRKLLVWSMRQADVLAVVSEAMREQAVRLGMPPERIVIASMGVDVAAFADPGASAPRAGIVFVGRLAEKKGVTHLLAAMHRLRGSVPGLQLRIVGDGPLRAGLERQAATLGLQESVEFLGARPPAEIPAFFQQARLFVMPSVIASTGDQEGLGLVAAEAMSCRCPVVAHDLAAVRDLVINDVTGLLVTPGDEAALADAMEKVLQSPELAARLAEAGQQHIHDNYSWQAVAARYRRIYEQGMAP